MFTKHFYRSEFTCKCGCGFDTVDYELLSVLKTLRAHYEQPITIASGCRCKKHNKRIGGVKSSFHLLGKAADFYIKDVSPADIYMLLDGLYQNKYGLALHPSFIHFDVRPEKYREVH